MRGAFMTPVKTWLGYPYPLGAAWMGNGVNFALFSETAASVELCLFENMEATEEYVRIQSADHLIKAGMGFCLTCGPGSCTVSAFPVRTIRNTDCVSTARNFFSIRTRKLSPEK